MKAESLLVHKGRALMTVNNIITLQKAGSQFDKKHLTLYSHRCLYVKVTKQAEGLETWVYELSRYPMSVVSVLKRTLHSTIEIKHLLRTFYELYSLAVAFRTNEWTQKS